MKAFLHERPILKSERKSGKLPLREIAAEVAQKVKAIWRKGSIPTVSHTLIVQLFLTYHDKKYSTLLKNIKSRGKAGEFSKQNKRFGEHSASNAFWYKRLQMHRFR